MKRCCSLGAASLAFLGMVGSAHAQTAVFDQIGDGSSFGTGFASQYFPDFAAFDTASLDDFTITGGVGQLTSVEAVVVGFTGFTSFANVQSWSIEVYSSVASAGANLTGDVLAFTIAASSGYVTVTDLALGRFRVSLDVSSFNLSLADGNYWLAVLPTMPFNPGGQLGVVGSGINDGPSVTPNAHQANPGGGFGFGATQLILDGGSPVNLAYRINAVPAPAALALLGLAGLAGSRRRRG